MTAVNELERIAKRDPKQRGIQYLFLAGELWNAALSLAGASHVVITTGFPCLITRTPPTETDGPLGAVSLARTLRLLDIKVISTTQHESFSPL